MRVFHLALLLSLPLGAQAALRDDLQLLTDLAPDDTVLAVRRDGPGTLLVRLRHAQGTEEDRRLTASTAFGERILRAARSDSTPPPAAVPGDSGTTPAPSPALQDKDNESRNRIAFNWGMGSLGAGAFYAMVVGGLQPKNGSTIAGTVLLGYPASYLSHYVYGKERRWSDAHLQGTSYAASSLYLGTFYTTWTLGGIDNGDAARAATFTSLAVYPIALFQGYLYGDRLRDNPGRVILANALCNQGMFSGALLPLVFPDFENSSDQVRRNSYRLSGLGLVGGGIGGHVLANHLFKGQRIPTGLGGGVQTLANLSALTGLQLASLGRKNDLQPNLTLGLILAGNTAGTAAALKLLPERRDTRERSLYINGGTVLGALGGLGLLLLLDPQDLSPASSLAFPTAGAWLGYGLTTRITSQLVEKNTTSPRPTPLEDISFAPFVIPVHTTHGTRWTWPGLQVSWR